MDPITLVLRASKTPAASAPVGGELSAAEVDANWNNLKTACEQLDAEKLDVADATTLTDVSLPLVASDETVIFRGGVGYKAPLSALKTFVLAASAPAAFTAGQWTATPGVGSIELNITALPDNGGSALTSLEYRLDGGSPVTLSGGATTGIRTITGLTGGTPYGVQIRAVNAVGEGAWSDTKTRTPTGAAATIVTSGTNGFAFGTSRTIAVPAGAAAGDRLVVMFDSANPVTGFSDNQGTSYTAPTIASAPSDERVYISAPLGATLPTTITVTFGSGTASLKADVFVVRGATNTVTGDGAFSTGFSTDPRSHAYTTTAANDLVFGRIDFTGGGVTGVTGQDAQHTWLLDSGSSLHRLATVRATAGSYGATLGPTGAGSASTGFWFRVAAS